MEKEKILEIEVKKGPLFLKKGEEIKVPVAPFVDSFDKAGVKTKLDLICIGTYIGDNFKNPCFQIVDIFFNIRENLISYQNELSTMGLRPLEPPKIKNNKNKLIENQKESLINQRFLRNGIQLIYLTLRVLEDMVINDRKRFTMWKDGFSVAVLTLSDKGFIGTREDTSGPAILDIIEKNLPISFSCYSMLPDDYFQILNILSDFAFNKKIDLIITTGGTGVSSRDITPDVTKRIIDKRLSGFEHAIFSEGLKKTKHAIISRAICGVANKSLVINLPGSEKAARENLMAVLPALEHTLKKINNDPTECGG